MFHFVIGDPNIGLSQVLEGLRSDGISEESRNGPVLRFPRPVCLEYPMPQERLVTSAIRDANPFFHLFETMWMFAGVNEIEPLLKYNSGMAQYSDDGKTLRGTAYGHRWRVKWGDQLQEVVSQLRLNPTSRQIVMSMWDPNELFMKNSKDFACNLQVMFSTRPNRSSKDGRRILDMTVTNRSNDLIYGSMGSNIFHFSMLHELVAFQSYLQLGTYYQIANNLHLYTENPAAARCLENLGRLSYSGNCFDDSMTRLGAPLLMQPYDDLVRKNFIQPGDQTYLGQVVYPMIAAYDRFKDKSYGSLNTRIESACEILDKCASEPLRVNGAEWLTRRMK